MLATIWALTRWAAQRCSRLHANIGPLADVVNAVMSALCIPLAANLVSARTSSMIMPIIGVANIPYSRMHAVLLSKCGQHPRQRLFSCAE